MLKEKTEKMERRLAMQRAQMVQELNFTAG